jgi:two-component system, chemotaxis family, protein-glutamate methylesterase/glutaminase
VHLIGARSLHSSTLVKPGEKTSLLIVDDDAPIRKLLERVALRAGFEVGLAKDGIEALEMLEQRPYSIAIIDLMMPRLSGYDLVQKISTMNPRPVILVATAMANSDVSKIDDTLVRRVIRKPFDVQAVAEALIEIAKQIAEKQAAPPADAVIRISAEDLKRQATEEADEQKKKEPQPPDAKPPN